MSPVYQIGCNRKKCFEDDYTENTLLEGFEDRAQLSEQSTPTVEDIRRKPRAVDPTQL